VADGPAGRLAHSAADGLTYAATGVDIAEGERAVELIGPLVASTRRPEVIGGIGGFGGMFAIPPGRYRQPVLVASTDGVGTKLEVARAVGRVDTIGIDLVAMCVDDLVCQGAEPLFFLDYLAVARLDPEEVEQIVAGIAAGCRQAGCALLGGEMAEHPGTMPEGGWDVAGFAVGIVERDEIIDGSAVRPGDVLVGLLSPGLRSNGYSLARGAIDRAGLELGQPAWCGADRTLGDELLVPSVVYAPVVGALIRAVGVHAVAHVTGGGIPGNVPRVLPTGTTAVIDRRTWSVPRIFTELIAAGGIDGAEALRVFNMGIGMVVAVTPTDAAAAIELAAAAGIGAAVIGEVEAGGEGVRFVGGA
jgi:phosphoribosylformylglycinamidine cyclo-ligase